MCAGGTPACSAGYWLDTAAKKCVACVTGCDACTSATACTTCATGYKKASATATNCVNTMPVNCVTVGATADVCSSCRVGSYINATNTCSNCNAGCTCSASTDLCTACQGGFVKDAVSTTFKCNACIAKCSACTAADTCDTCNDGFYKATDAKSCIACPTNAKTCTSATAVVCKDSF